MSDEEIDDTVRIEGTRPITAEELARIIETGHLILVQEMTLDEFKRRYPEKSTD